MDTTVIDHTHCNLNLFHDAEPLHTHAHCKNCFRMRRCEGNSVDWKLQVCSGCNIVTYCSKACQKEHWKKGHKHICKIHTIGRDRAIELSGNPKAWLHLASWVTIHHATLINATLACLLHMKDKIPDVAATHLLHISLDYRNDASLPVEQQFKMRGARLSPKDDPDCAELYRSVFAEREGIIKLAKMNFGSDYWNVGAYILVVRFRPHKTEPGVDGILFWKTFGIDKWRANAVLSCRNPLDQLRENLHEGKRLRFCCGKIEGLPTCCCGGWTHEVSGHKAKVPW